MVSNILGENKLVIQPRIYTLTHTSLAKKQLIYFQVQLETKITQTKACQKRTFFLNKFTVDGVSSQHNRKVRNSKSCDISQNYYELQNPEVYISIEEIVISRSRKKVTLPIKRGTLQIMLYVVDEKVVYILA